MWKMSKSVALAVALILMCSVALLAQPSKNGEYYEDFSKSDGWYSQYWNSGGFIEITEEDEGRAISIPCPYTLSGPFFEVDFLFTECEDGVAGIVLDPADDTEWNYVVFINVDGYYSFQRLSPDGSEWTVSKGWTYSRHILQGTGVVNQIAIEVLPRMALYSFNGTLVDSLNAKINPGGIKLSVGTFDGATTVRFDNLRVYEGSTSDMD